MRIARVFQMQEQILLYVRKYNKIPLLSHKQGLIHTWICPECGLINRRVPKNFTFLLFTFTLSIIRDTAGAINESLRVESVK